MPTEFATKPVELYYKKKLKWYQKIWYFVTGKKNKPEKLNYIRGISDENND